MTICKTTANVIWIVSLVKLIQSKTFNILRKNPHLVICYWSWCVVLGKTATYLSSIIKMWVIAVKLLKCYQCGISSFGNTQSWHSDIIWKQDIILMSMILAWICLYVYYSSLIWKAEFYWLVVNDTKEVSLNISDLPILLIYNANIQAFQN